MPDPQTKHVFISYVRENQDQVDRLCESLKKSGVIVWLDRYDITPGILWEDAIRQAIRDGAFFIACFSKKYREKTNTHMSEELNLAIEVLRKRPRDRAWFIPVVLPGGGPDDVPDWETFPGKTLRSIQWVPLYEDWDAGIQRILSVIKPTPPNIQNLISALCSGSGRVRWSALYELKEIGPNAIFALIRTLKDENKDVRWGAAWALGEIGPEAEAAVPVLKKLLKDKNRGVRLSAIDALKKISSSYVLSAFVECLKDEDEEVRYRVEEALGEIGPAAMPVLIGALKDKNVHVRKGGSGALRIIGPKAETAVPDLVEILKDVDEDVGSRISAMWALVRISSKAAVPVLVAALKDENKKIRWNAIQAFEQILPEAKGAVPDLVEALNDEDRKIRWNAVRIMGEIGPEAKAAVPTLIAALKDKKREVRENAAVALQKINTPEARKALADHKKRSI